MKSRTLLFVIAILALTTALMSGCLFGGGADDDGEEAAPGEEGMPPEGPGEGPPGEMPMDEDGMAPPPEPGADFGPPEGPPGEAPAEPDSMGPPEGGPAGGGSVSAALDMKHNGNYEGAADELNSVLASDPNNAEAHWALAWILAEQGKTDNDSAKINEAKQHFNQFIDMSSDQSKISEAEAALARLE
ncbi:MAG: tetratricopeptide repeat protein [Armatimonadota bacterium]